MKVLLIRPPQEFGRGSHVVVHADVPLALMYLGAVAERAGHQVVVFDGAVQEEPARLIFDEDGILHVGAAWDEVARVVGATAA